MATIAAPVTSPLQRERTFYFVMSLFFLAAAVGGFGFFFVIGASTFASPWWVHVHAVTMTAFLSLYVVQTWLVHRGDPATHRRLGALGARSARGSFFTVSGPLPRPWQPGATRRSLPPTGS